MKLSCLWKLLVWGALLALAGAVGADDSALLLQGGLASPMQEHPTIQMATAAIKAEIHDGYSLVQCDFVFRNDGPATTVQMGFPSLPGYGDIPPQRVAPPLEGFHTWVDGQEVGTRQVREAKTSLGAGRRFYVKQVAFAAGQERKVHDSYIQPNGHVSDGSQWFSYALKTGASWHGPIGSLTVQLRWAESWDWAPILERSEQPRWERQPSFREIRWSAQDLEPDFDLRFDFTPGWREVHVDGCPVGSFGQVQVRPEPTQCYLAARSLAQVMQATCEWDERTRTARFDLSGDRRYLARAGSPVTFLDGRKLMDYQDAAFEERGTLWVPLSPILHALGWKWTTLYPECVLKIETGGPVAWEAEVQGLERDKGPESLYLARQDGVLMGELRPLLRAIPGARTVAQGPATEQRGWRGDLGVTWRPGSAPRPAKKPAPAPSAGSPPPPQLQATRELRLRWGKTEAWLDGKPYQLPVAPFISPADTGMVPVQAVCEAFGLTSAYDEEKKLLTISVP